MSKIKEAARARIEKRNKDAEAYLRDCYFDLQKRENNLIRRLANVVEYCRDHTDQMWAASVVGYALNCDFRDAKTKLHRVSSIQAVKNTPQTTVAALRPKKLQKKKAL